MGQFDPSPSEMQIIAGFFSEASEFLGNAVSIYPVTNYPQENSQGDPTPVYGTPLQTNGMFDIRPNRRTLDGYGWYAEDPDAQPILIYLPQYDSKGNLIVLKQRTKISVDNNVDGIDGNKYFEVYKFLTTGIPGWYWISWIVPLRNEYPPITSTPNASNHYLNFDFS